MHQFRNCLYNVNVTGIQMFNMNICIKKKKIKKLVLILVKQYHRNRLFWKPYNSTEIIIMILQYFAEEFHHDFYTFICRKNTNVIEMRLKTCKAYY